MSIAKVRFWENLIVRGNLARQSKYRKLCRKLELSAQSRLSHKPIFKKRKGLILVIYYTILCITVFDRNGALACMIYYSRSQIKKQAKIDIE